MVRGNGTASVSPPKLGERERPDASAGPAPDPEVSARATRRRFTAEHKRSVLLQADACRKPGELGALLRREGIYSSLLAAWRKQREAGALVGEGRRRGPKSNRPDPRTSELERENRRLKRALEKAQLVIELQKKLSIALGIPLSEAEPDENER